MFLLNATVYYLHSTIGVKNKSESANKLWPADINKSFNFESVTHTSFKTDRKTNRQTYIVFISEAEDEFLWIIVDMTSTFIIDKIPSLSQIDAVGFL